MFGFLSIMPALPESIWQHSGLRSRRKTPSLPCRAPLEQRAPAGESARRQFRSLRLAQAYAEILRSQFRRMDPHQARSEVSAVRQRQAR